MTTYSDDHAICQFCGAFHSKSFLCPSVKEISYYPNGAIKSVVMRDIIVHRALCPVCGKPESDHLSTCPANLYTGSDRA